VALSGPVAVFQQIDEKIGAAAIGQAETVVVLGLAIQPDQTLVKHPAVFAHIVERATDVVGRIQRHARHVVGRRLFRVQTMPQAVSNGLASLCAMLARESGTPAATSRVA